MQPHVWKVLVWNVSTSQQKKTLKHINYQKLMIIERLLTKFTIFHLKIGEYIGFFSKYQMLLEPMDTKAQLRAAVDRLFT